MDSTTIRPPNPVVMAQQIQVLKSNVQELMKQNENLKRRTSPKGSNTSFQRHNRSWNNDEVNSPKNSKGRDTFEHIKQLTHDND